MAEKSYIGFRFFDCMTQQWDSCDLSTTPIIDVRTGKDIRHPDLIEAQRKREAIQTEDAYGSFLF